MGFFSLSDILESLQKANQKRERERTVCGKRMREKKDGSTL